MVGRVSQDFISNVGRYFSRGRRRVRTTSSPNPTITRDNGARVFRTLRHRPDVGSFFLPYEDKHPPRRRHEGRSAAFCLEEDENGFKRDPWHPQILPRHSGSRVDTRRRHGCCSRGRITEPFRGRSGVPASPTRADQAASFPKSFPKSRSAMRWNSARRSRVYCRGRMHLQSGRIPPTCRQCAD